MSEAAAFRDRMRESIETVESEDVWCAFASIQYSERLNVIVGTPSAPEADRLLSVQVEIIHPAYYFDPDRLSADETTLAETHPYLADFVDDLSDAIAAATGEGSIGPFRYHGLEPGTPASSAVFGTTISREE